MRVRFLNLFVEVSQVCGAPDSTSVKYLIVFLVYLSLLTLIGFPPSFLNFILIISTDTCFDLTTLISVLIIFQWLRVLQHNFLPTKVKHLVVFLVFTKPININFLNFILQKI